MKFITFVVFLVICWSFCANSSGFVTANPTRNNNGNDMSNEQMILIKLEQFAADYVYKLGETNPEYRHIVGASLSQKFAKKPVRFDYDPYQRASIIIETDTEYVIYNLQVGKNLITKYNVQFTSIHLNYEYFGNDDVTRQIFNNYISNCGTLQSFYPENYSSSDESTIQKNLPKSKQSNDELESVLYQLRPYLSNDEIEYARNLDSYSEIEEYLSKCINNRLSEIKQQKEATLSPPQGNLIDSNESNESKMEQDDLNVENESDYEIELESDSDLLSESDSESTVAEILAMLAPFNAEDAYNWGENHPAYKKIVGQSLSNDLNKFGGKLVRFGDIPDRNKNIWHETKSECRIYNFKVGVNLITNYNIEITSMYVNYAHFKDSTTRNIFNNYISVSETLKEFQYKNGDSYDQFYIDWSLAHVHRIVPTTRVPLTKKTTAPKQTHPTSESEVTTEFTKKPTTIERPPRSNEPYLPRIGTNPPILEEIPVEEQGIENVEDESELSEERVLAILAPFDAEEAYNWGEEHPEYRTIVGKSISKDKNKFGGKKVVFNFKVMPVMAMAEHKHECEIKDADVAMNLLQYYGVEIKEFEIYYLTMLDEHCTIVNRYIKEHENEFKFLLKHDENMNEEAILNKIASLSAKAAFEWAEAEHFNQKYKVLVGKSLSKDENKFANREVVIGDQEDQKSNYFVQNGDKFKISLGYGVKLLRDYKIKFSTVANLIIDCKHMTSQYLSFYKLYIKDNYSSNPKLITGPITFLHVPQEIRDEINQAQH